MHAFQHHMHWQNYKAALGALGQLVPLWFIGLVVATTSRLRPLLPPFLDHKFHVSNLKKVIAGTLLDTSVYAIISPSLHQPDAILQDYLHNMIEASKVTQTHGDQPKTR